MLNGLESKGRISVDEKILQMLQEITTKLDRLDTVEKELGAIRDEQAQLRQELNTNKEAMAESITETLGDMYQGIQQRFDGIDLAIDYLSGQLGRHDKDIHILKSKQAPPVNPTT